MSRPPKERHIHGRLRCASGDRQGDVDVPCPMDPWSGRISWVSLDVPYITYVYIYIYIYIYIQTYIHTYIHIFFWLWHTEADPAATVASLNSIGSLALEKHSTREVWSESLTVFGADQGAAMLSKSWGDLDRFIQGTTTQSLKDSGRKRKA